MSTIDGRVRDAVMAHRYRFLWAVQKLVPEVLVDLERDVLPHFRAMYRNEQRMELGESGTFVWSASGTSSSTLWITWPSSKEARQKEEMWFGPSWATDIRGVPLDSGGLKFRDAMEEWAAKHHLRSEAILGDAFSTLRFWLVNPFGQRVWAPPGAFWTPDELKNLPKLHIEDTWSFEPWSNVEKRLKEKIAIYKSEAKKYSAKIGFDADRMRDDRTHHQWLALYQCKGMSSNQILAWEAKHNNRKVDPSAVRHAVSELAQTIGLALRAGKRGRRRSG